VQQHRDDIQGIGVGVAELHNQPWLALLRLWPHKMLIGTSLVRFGLADMAQ
jgi:hypothetical protein